MAPVTFFAKSREAFDFSYQKKDVVFVHYMEKPNEAQLGGFIAFHACRKLARLHNFSALAIIISRLWRSSLFIFTNCGNVIGCDYFLLSPASIIGKPWFFN